MAGRYGLYGFNTSYGGGGSSRGNSMRDEELNEEDVWGMGRESSPILRRPSSSTSSKEATSFTALRRIPTASRMIPRAHNNNNNNSSSTRESSVLQQSAPVNIPDWSKIYRKNLNIKKSNGSSSWVDDDDNDDIGTGYDLGEDRKHYGVDDDDDDDDDWLPPHEFIAKKLARSQISSFSVCEGVGRTLKGRDLTKVRNAVLTRTGFLQ